VFLERRDRYELQARWFFQPMTLASDNKAGAYTGTRGAGACSRHGRTRWELWHHQLSQRQWILLAAPVSPVAKAHPAAPSNSSNHERLFPWYLRMSFCWSTWNFTIPFAFEILRILSGVELRSIPLYTLCCNCIEGVFAIEKSNERPTGRIAEAFSTRW